MTVLLAVLLASLAGSMHCAAMCGGFVCVYAGGRPGQGSPGAHAAYNAGRLASYVTLGALAGALGGRVDQLGAVVGLGRAAAVVAGALMVLWASTEIAVALGAPVRLFAAPGAAWVRRTIGRGLVATRNGSPPVRAATIGVLTALLPCGWLYAFVASAAATGGAGSGALLMLAFWAGTVPMLLGVGMGAQRIFGRLAGRVPLVGAGIVLVLGLLSIAGRMPGVRTAGHDGGVHRGHAGVAAPEATDGRR